MGIKWAWEFRITEGKRTTSQEFPTKREVINAMAAWSLRIYERSGNFDHCSNGSIRRVGASL